MVKITPNLSSAFRHRQVQANAECLGRGSFRRATLIVGDPATFAIESAITQAYARVSERALGYFVIHVSGKMFGVKEPDASCLACSYDEVADRLLGRGKHSLSVLDDIEAAQIAEAYLDAVHRASPRTDYFGVPHQQLVDRLHDAAIVWAPDGDQAFDDGSHVLQLDVGKEVRLIAFKNTDDPLAVPNSVAEGWLPADFFYETLLTWRNSFQAEWRRALG